ncbi:ATPAF2, partial [Symbiodinium necroappetens]
AKARKATAAAEASAASSKDGVTSGDGLSDIRERLLASESESDNEEQDSGSEEEDKERSHGKPGQEDRAPFSWSQFAKEGEAALGPVPTRQLERAGGGDRIQAATFGGRYTDQDRLPGSRRIARRKALGVRTKNRLDAGRNYASPDDDLLV